MSLRVAYFSKDAGLSPLEHLRIVSPLEHAGIEIVHGIENGNINLKSIEDSDFTVIQRDFPRDLDKYEIIKDYSRARNIPIIYDIDDLLLELPQSHPDRLSGYYTSALLPILRAIVESDLVTTPSKRLREILLPFNSNIAVLANYIDDSIWNFRNPSLKDSHQPLIIGYMGSDSHEPDLESIYPILRIIQDEFPGKVLFHFYGTKPHDLMENNQQVLWTPIQTYNYKLFSEDFQKQKFDIFIAPLNDNQFNRCKSSIKFLEYSSLGAPGVFSDIDPYNEIITDEKDGLLASTEDDWYEKIKRLINDDELRYQLAVNAQITVSEKWLISKNAFLWKNVYLDAHKGKIARFNSGCLSENLIKSINDQLNDYQPKTSSENPSLSELLILLAKRVDKQHYEKAEMITLLNERNGEVKEAIAKIKIQTKEMDDLKIEIKDKAASVSLLSEELEEYKKQNIALEEEQLVLQHESDSLKEKVQELRNDLLLVESKLEENKEENERLLHQSSVNLRDLSIIHNSITWKLALVLRKISSVFFPSTSWQYFIFQKLILKIKKFKGKRQLNQDVSLIRKSIFFDKDWYLNNYVDVLNARVNPAKHFIEFGGFEGRNPSEKFDSNWYFQKYSDVFLSGMNPLVHYLRYGLSEGREIRNAQPKTVNSALINQEPTSQVSINNINNEDGLMEYASILMGVSKQELQRNKNVPIWYIRKGWQINKDKTSVEDKVNQIDKFIRFTIVMILDSQPPHLVDQAIQSVTLQTYQRWNLKVYVDRRGIFNAEVLALAYEQQRENIRFTSFDSPQEITADLISVVSSKNQDYLIFLNPYDELDNDCLLLVTEKIEKSFPDIVYTEISEENFIKIKEKAKNLFLYTDIPVMQLFVIKNKLLASIDPISTKAVCEVISEVLLQANKLTIQKIDSNCYYSRAIPGRSFMGWVNSGENLRLSNYLTPTNVLVDARLLSRKVTGTERYIWELLKSLSKIRKKFGLKLKAISFTDPVEEIDGVEFITSDHLSAIMNSDIFHKTFPASDNVTLCEMALAPAIAFSPLDLIAFNNPDYYPDEFSYIQYRNKLKSAAMISDKIVAISEHGKTEIVSYFGVTEEKVNAIYLGVNQDKFLRSKKEREPILKGLNIPDKYFLFIGTDYPHKNLITVLKAIQILGEEVPEISLVVVGTKYYVKPQPELTDMMDSLNDRIIHLGHVPDEILPALYHNSRALIFPSLYEGFGLPVLEAMLCETPVISSNCTSLPEVCGEAAMFFDGYDERDLALKMKMVWRDDAVRSKLIEAGLRNVQKFKWEQTAKSTARLYKSAISSASSLSCEERTKIIINNLKENSLWKPTILLVTHVRFYPPSAGNEQRIFKFISYLRRIGYQIVVLVNPFLEVESLNNKQLATIHQFVDYYEEITSSFSAIDKRSIESDSISKWSEVEGRFCPDSLLEKFRQLVEYYSPQVVVAEYIWTSRIFEKLPRSILKIIDMHDLFSQKKDNVIKFGIKDDLAISEEEELAFIERADVALAIQEIEAEKLRALKPKVEVLTAGIDYEINFVDSNLISEPSLLIIGSGNQINNHCVNEFLDQCWPQIHENVPECTLIIVGKVCNSVDKDHKSVSLVPFADDLLPFYTKASIVINPVYAGTGLKIKSVEAIGHGKALISWPEGVAGIDVQEPYPFVVINSWEELSQSAINLLNTGETRLSLEERAKAYAKANLSDKRVYGEIADRIDIHCKRRINILCLYLRYGSVDYPESLNILIDWYREKQKETDVSLTVWIIDNKIEGDYDGVDLQTGFRLIAGDNRQREFSGFQKILEKYRDEIDSYDLVHFVTSAFNQLFTGYLDYFKLSHLYPVLHRPVCLGHIDMYDEPIKIMGKSSQSWIRTCFFFVSPLTISSLPEFNIIKECNEIFDEDGNFFKDGIIDDKYKSYLTRWLTGDKIQGVAWHNTIENKYMFEEKSLAIINEHLLSINLRKNSIQIIDFHWLINNYIELTSSRDFLVPNGIEQVKVRQDELFG